jgi:hypothetical protein
VAAAYERLQASGACLPRARAQQPASVVGRRGAAVALRVLQQL